MADQTILVTSDVHIDSGANNEGTTGINEKAADPNRANIFLRFDVSSLAGKMWDSVVLKATWRLGGSIGGSGPHYLARVLQTVVYNQVTSTEYSSGNSWSAAFAENSLDNDHSTRIDQSDAIDLSVTHSVDDVFTSTDITSIVQGGVLQGGTLDIILYGTGTGNAITWKPLEFVGITVAQTIRLFVSNVQDAEGTTSSTNGTATNVAVPSASVLSKSGRPPIAGADRQVTASILHDGVEPFTVLSITLKGDYGTDN